MPLARIMGTPVQVKSFSWSSEKKPLCHEPEQKKKWFALHQHGKGDEKLNSTVVILNNGI